jgi:beta-lactamase regulating signal transducer with metallopeptidase domain
MMIWLLDTMIAMTLLMALVLLLRRPVARVFGPRIAYALWLLPLARLFVPSRTVELTAPGLPAAPMLPAAASLPATLPTGLPLTQLGQEASTALPVDWAMLALTLWLAGAGLFFVSKLAAYAQFRSELLADARPLDERDGVRIVETMAVSGPLAFGLTQRFIAVPANFRTMFTPHEQELAIAHELAHHRGRDLIANLVALMLLSLHWCNPVAWAAWKAFREDQETACDARVLGHYGHAARASYGRAIAKSAMPGRLGLVSPMNDRANVKNRLRMLGRGPQSRWRGWLGGGLVIAALGITLPLTATVVYAEADPPVVAAADNAPKSYSHSEIDRDDDGNIVRSMTIESRQTADGQLLSIRRGTGGRAEAQHVRTIKRGGKVIVISSDTPVSNAQVEALIARSQSVLAGSKDERVELVVLPEGKLLPVEGIAREAEALAEIVREEAWRKEERQWQEFDARMEAWAERFDKEMAQWEKEMEQWGEQFERDARRRAPGASRTPAPPKPPVAPAAPQPPALPSMISWSAPIVGSQCAMHALDALSGPSQMIEARWAEIVRCTGLDPETHAEQLLAMTLESLRDERARFARSCADPDAKHRQTLRNFDREIAHLERKVQRT